MNLLKRGDFANQQKFIIFEDVISLWVFAPFGEIV